jgi:hypothetical protein
VKSQRAYGQEAENRDGKPVGRLYICVSNCVFRFRIPLTTAMTADQWITAYGESHQNPTNKLIHFIFVPTIMFTLVGLLWSIPMPAVVAENVPYLNVATLFVLFC